MKVSLAYGEGDLVVDLPGDRTSIVSPRQVVPPDRIESVLASALQNPVAGPRLSTLVRPEQRVAIAVCDGTRPQPRREMLGAIMKEIHDVLDDIKLTILIATGSHRGNTKSELDWMFGRELVNRFEIVNHDARDRSMLTWCGKQGNGVPVWLNRRWVEADLRITTGFVEPHFFAGFSGGPKLVAPGLAGMDTILTLHDYSRIADPRATWGVTEGNPVHDDVRAIASASGVDFAFDVVLNRDQQVVKAFAGMAAEMHAKACVVARQLAMVPVDGLYDVVVTSNSGFPLDQNVYQTVKGMSAASQIVKRGGLIVCVAECRDGFPDHGGYQALLTSCSSLAEAVDAMASAPVVTPDQWQVQVQAKVQKHAKVAIYTDGLGDELLAAAHLEKTLDVGRTVLEALALAGPSSRVCVLPDGPQTIPYLPGVGPL